MFLDSHCLRIHQLSLSKPPPVGHQLAEMHTVDREFVCPAMKGTIMIVTTTYNVEGRQISEYIRVVAGETVSGINMFRDLAAGFRNIVGGRSQAYEEEMINARENALAEMVQRAIELGAEGVVGVDIDYVTMGSDNGMMMVSATGTAVRFAPAY
jgi:UPF0145 protein jk0060